MNGEKIKRKMKGSEEKSEMCCHGYGKKKDEKEPADREENRAKIVTHYPRLSFVFLSLPAVNSRNSLLHNVPKTSL